VQVVRRTTRDLSLRSITNEPLTSAGSPGGPEHQCRQAGFQSRV